MNSSFQFVKQKGYSIIVEPTTATMCLLWLIVASLLCDFAASTCSCKDSCASNEYETTGCMGSSQFFSVV
jgi:hypothetical protein